MTDTPSPDSGSNGTPPAREYDKTGFYPPEGKAFRLWALLAWNIGVLVVLAAVAALINYLVL